MGSKIVKSNGYELLYLKGVKMLVLGLMALWTPLPKVGQYKKFRVLWNTLALLASPTQDDPV